MAKVAPIDIGDMNRRVTICELSDPEDGQGGAYEDLSDKFSCWAYVEPMTGTRAFENYQIEGKQSYRIIIRYRANVTTENLVKYGSLTLTIHSAADLYEDRQFLELICFR